MVIATRRRAADFDVLVEDLSASREATSYAVLLDLVDALRAVPDPVPRADFVSVLREQLLAEAATVLVPASAEDQRLRLAPRRSTGATRHPRRVAALVSGVAAAGVTTSMAFAAQTALPGDLLYPVKIGVENVHAAVAFDDAQRGATVLASARDRLQEVARLSAAGHDSSQVAPTLDSFTAQASTASDVLLADYAATGDESSISSVRDFTASSMSTLSDLQSAVPADSLDELLHAATVLQAIEQSALHACPACSGASVTDVPTVFTESLAPLPGFGTTAVAHLASNRHPHIGRHRSGTPALPHVESHHLPPGSVNDGADGGTAAAAVTAPDDTIGGLTGGLTTGQSSSDSVGDPASTLLDAVGQAGDAVGDLSGTDVPTDVPSDVPTRLPTDPTSALPSGTGDLPSDPLPALPSTGVTP